MRKSMTTAVGLTLAGAFLAVPALAATQDRTKIEKRFERLDANKDGVLESREFARLSTRQFKRLDIDGDGYVTSDEMAARRKTRIEKRRPATDEQMAKITARMEKHLAAIDKNGDGRLDLDEFIDREHPFVKRGDADGDGVLTVAEFQSSIEKRRARRARK